MRLKKGTKVIISNKSIHYDKDGQLPIGVVGIVRIDDTSDDYPYVVYWFDGHNNNYNRHDLIVVDFNEYLKRL